MHLEITDKEFEDIVKTAMDNIPERYGLRLKNVGFVIEDEPSPEQRERLKLHAGQTLYGLYEGIPLTKRGNNYSGVLPDKITIFKNPAVAQSRDRQELEAKVQNTVWHEVAHYFGLDHDRIHELEKQ